MQRSSAALSAWSRRVGRRQSQRANLSPTVGLGSFPILCQAGKERAGFYAYVQVGGVRQTSTSSSRRARLIAVYRRRGSQR